MVEAARAVAPVVPLVAEVARLQVELETARAAVAAAGTELAEVLPATGTDGAAMVSMVRWLRCAAARWPAPTELSSVARRRRDEVAQLRAMGAAEAEADRLAAATDALQRRAVELDAQAERLAARLDAAPARRAELETARDRSQAAVAALPGAVAARDLAAGRSEAAARRDRLDAQRVALADVVRTRTDAAQAARQTWLDLRQARLEGMAAELAAVLVDGVGCPVCGSTEHPVPAEAGPGSVGLDDETAAAEALAAAEDLRVAAADQLAALDTRRAAARAAAGGDETYDVLRAAQDGAVAVAAALAEQAAEAESDAAALARFGEEARGLGAGAGLPRPERCHPQGPGAGRPRPAAGAAGHPRRRARHRPVHRGPGGATGAAGRRSRRPGPAGRDGGPARGAGGRRPGAGRAGRS